MQDLKLLTEIIVFQRFLVRLSQILMQDLKLAVLAVLAFALGQIITNLNARSET